MEKTDLPIENLTDESSVRFAQRIRIRAKIKPLITEFEEALPSLVNYKAMPKDVEPEKCLFQ
jgi:formiminotetrahydrofolate cyclodeaminase